MRKHSFHQAGPEKYIYNFPWRIFARGNHEGCALSSTNLPLASSDSRLETVNLCDEGFSEVTQKKRYDVSEVICDTIGSVPGLCF